jgi:oligopeptide/dipeptide ABC transporter ATP-binding protein
MPNIAELEDLKVYFYDQRDKRFIRAVENVGFNISKNSITGLVGESGCGKTVTALSMMGLLDSEPGIIGGHFFFGPRAEDVTPITQHLVEGGSEGEIYSKDGLLDLFHGLEWFVQFRSHPFTIIKDSEKWLRRNDRIMEHIRGKNISMVFQNPSRSLNPFIPVGRQLAGTVRRFNKDQDEDEIYDISIDLLRSVRLYQPENVMSMYTRSLSVGMAQRVVLAIALSSNPRVLIADEPTTGLDTPNIHKIIELLESLVAERRLTLVLISHNLRIVSDIANDIVVMYAGIVVERGSKKDIIRAKRGPRHPYTEELVSSVPSDTEIKRGKKIKVIPGTVLNNMLEMGGCPFLERCPHAVGRVKKICSSKFPEMVEVSTNHFIRCYRDF